MKNRRNTRRGRAKRWVLIDIWRTCPTFSLRGASVWVWKGYYSGAWFVGGEDIPFDYATFPSRAAAMRAAEELARGRK